MVFSKFWASASCRSESCICPPRWCRRCAVLALDRLGVDVGAVRAPQVFNLDTIRHHVDGRVFAAHRQVVDHDVVVRAAAQRGALFGELHFFDDDAVDQTIILGMMIYS